MIDRRFFKALRIIISRLENKGINWVLGGSVNLALQNVDVSPRDIDILTDRKGAFHIMRLLKDYETQKVKLTKSEKMSSYMGKLRIEGLEVEVIGDFQTKTPKGEWTMPFKPERKVILTIEDVRIPVSPLETELKAYEILGRTDKVQKIREALRKQSRDLV